MNPGRSLSIYTVVWSVVCIFLSFSVVFKVSFMKNGLIYRNCYKETSGRKDYRTHLNHKFKTCIYFDVFSSHKSVLHCIWVEMNCMEYYLGQFWMLWKSSVHVYNYYMILLLHKYFSLWTGSYMEISLWCCIWVEMNCLVFSNF